MRKIFVLVGMSLMLLGCSATTHVVIGSAGPVAPIHTASLLTNSDDAPQMGRYIKSDLQSRGVVFKSLAKDGAHAKPGVDAVVSYEQQWRWDVMDYLSSVDINFTDPKTGALIVSGRWENSPMHLYPSADAVAKRLLDAIYQKAGWPLDGAPR